MTRRLTVVLAVLACAVVGCGGDDDDAGSPPPTSAGAASPTPAASDRPEIRVTNPRDISALVTDPCKAFTAEQLTSAGFPAAGELHPADPGSLTSRAYCRWFRPGLANASLKVLVYEPFGRDSTAHGFLDAGVSKAVQWVEIAGNTATLEQLRAENLYCDAIVAVNGSDVLVVTFDKRPDDPVNPCVTARGFAEIAVGNLPPKS